MALTLERLLGARISDNVVHGWDLSQALSVPYEIEEETAEWLLDFWLSLFDFLTDSKHFSSPVEPVDAPDYWLCLAVPRNPKNHLIGFESGRSHPNLLPQPYGSFVFCGHRLGDQPFQLFQFLDQSGR